MTGGCNVANRSLENVTRGVRVTVCDINSEYYGNLRRLRPVARPVHLAFGLHFGQPGPGVRQRRGQRTASRFSTGKARCCPPGESTARNPASWTPHRAWPSTPHDNLYVADTYNHRVQKFTAEGRFPVVISVARAAATASSACPGA